MLGHHRSARLFRLGTALCLAIGAAGCAVGPPPPLPAAADPGARVPTATYRPVISSDGKVGPAEPSPWPDINRDAAPPSGKGEQQ